MNALKLTLDKEYLKEYALVGIACHLKDYRLIYNINQVLDCDLKKQDDLIIYPTKNKKELSFSFYSFQGDNIEYYIVSNTNPEGILISEQKNIDFVLILKGQTSKQIITSVINSISKIPSVLMAYEINTNSIKSIDIIISDLELHLIELARNKKGRV